MPTNRLHYPPVSHLYTFNELCYSHQVAKPSSSKESHHSIKGPHLSYWWDWPITYRRVKWFLKKISNTFQVVHYCYSTPIPKFHLSFFNLAQGLAVPHKCWMLPFKEILSIFEACTKNAKKLKNEEILYSKKLIFPLSKSKTILPILGKHQKYFKILI